MKRFDFVDIILLSFILGCAIYLFFIDYLLFITYIF